MSATAWPLSGQSLAPGIGENHPSVRALDAIHSAAQIAVGIAEYMETEEGRNFCGRRIVDLLAKAAGHVGALKALLERQERVIEEQRVECLREKEYSRKVEDKNSELVQSVIDLTRRLEELGADTSTLPRSVAAAGGA